MSFSMQPATLLTKVNASTAFALRMSERISSLQEPSCSADGDEPFYRMRAFRTRDAHTPLALPERLVRSIVYYLLMMR